MDLFQFPIDFKSHQAAKVEQELASLAKNYMKLLDFLVWIIQQPECPPTFRVKCEDLVREMQRNE